MTERLFFALWPDAPLRREIQGRLAGWRPPGRAVAAANWHITLAFLGEVDADTRRCCETAAAGVHGRAFRLTMDRLGYFHRTRVLWLGASETPAALQALHGDLKGALEQAGFMFDSRPFRAHITLARKAPPARALPHPAPVSWPVDRFHLVRSRLSPGGAQYHKEKEYLLTA